MNLDLIHQFRNIRSKIVEGMGHGMQFELTYSKAIAGGDLQFHNFIHKFKSLIRITKGKNVILSCGQSSDQLNAQRSPYDIANM